MNIQVQNLESQSEGMTMTYEIRVKNHLDLCWQDWFDDWEITNLEEGTLLLSSATADQSALHGALNKIRDLNLKLISVVEVGKPPPMKGTSTSEAHSSGAGQSGKSNS